LSNSVNDSSREQEVDRLSFAFPFISLRVIDLHAVIRAVILLSSENIKFTIDNFSKVPGTSWRHVRYSFPDFLKQEISNSHMHILSFCPFGHLLIGLFASFGQSQTKNFSHDFANNNVAVRKLKNILIASELSSLNFNSSVSAEQWFAVRYPNIVIKSLCGNLLDFCLSYHANA